MRTSYIPLILFVLLAGCALEDIEKLNKCSQPQGIVTSSLDSFDVQATEASKAKLAQDKCPEEYPQCILLGKDSHACSPCEPGKLFCDGKCVPANSEKACGRDCEHIGVCPDNLKCIDGECTTGATSCGKDQLKCFCTLKNMQIVCSDKQSETSELQCFDRNSNDTCNISKCEQYNTPEVQCSGDTKCQNIGTEENPDFACQCPVNTVKVETQCVSPFSEEYCGITAEHPEIYTTCQDERICDGTKCHCPSGTQECDGVCIDTKTSQNHCGACDNECKANETCVLSSCKCNSGGRCGGDICKDNSNDHDHCGGKGECNSADASSENYQGLICGEREICENNICKCDTSKYAFCNGTCIDPMTDNAFCGADANCSKYENCNTIQGASCLTGKCECPNDMKKMKTLINDTEVYKCFDTQNDPTCCGGQAGSQCQNCGNMLCINGLCKDASCKDGTLNCRNRCLSPEIHHVQQVSVQDKSCKCYKDSTVEYCDDDDDITNGCPDQKVGDIEHCYGCGNACPKGYTACIKVAGTPQCSCQEGQTLCNNGTESDPEIHCYTPEDMEQLHLSKCQTCASGWAKAPDAPWSTGCPIDLKTTTEHCGSYDIDCNKTILNATSPWCNEGKCDYKDCISDTFYDCDNRRDNGCNADLTTSTTCGKCFNSCNMFQACQNGGCCYKDGHTITMYDKCCNHKYRKRRLMLVYDYKCASDSPGDGWELLE